MNFKIKIAPLFFAYLAFLVLVDSSAYMLIIVLTALLHECAHLAVMKMRCITVKEMYFSPLGIRITPAHSMDYKSEILVAMAGPLVNLAVFTALYLLSGYIMLPYFLAQAAVCSFILGFGNLIPILPLDGGRILRGILYMYAAKNAESILCFVNVGFSIAFTALGMYALAKTGFNISLLLIGIYLSASFAAVFKGSRKCLKKE